MVIADTIGIKIDHLPRPTSGSVIADIQQFCAVENKPELEWFVCDPARKSCRKRGGPGASRHPQPRLTFADGSFFAVPSASALQARSALTRRCCLFAKPPPIFTRAAWAAIVGQGPQALSFCVRQSRLFPSQEGRGQAAKSPQRIHKKQTTIVGLRPRASCRATVHLRDQGHFSLWRETKPGSAPPLCRSPPCRP
jgi:hypothetical protein